MVKKVVVTVGKFKDYIDEIQQSYVLGFTPYRLHKNADGTFVTPIRVYDGMVYVLDDVATMEVGDRDLITVRINSKLIYFGDWISGVASQGDRGSSGARGLKGDSGDNVALKDPKVLLETLVTEVELEHVVKRRQGSLWRRWSTRTYRSTM